MSAALFCKVIDWVAVFMACSIAFYAFTGVHLWAPVPVNENGMTDPARGTLLLLVHVVPITLAGLRRLGE